MRLQSINLNNFYKNYNYKQTNSKQNIEFGAGMRNSLLASRISAEKILSKFEKFNKSEYLAMRNEDKQLLRDYMKKMDIPEFTQVFFKKAIEAHNYTAELIRQTFDYNYGKDNYVVIMIGRSLSSIGKMLGFKIGENNVKNIPMSALRMYKGFSPETVISRMLQKIDLPFFKNYLKYQGLSPDIIESSGKQYIIMDYESTGASLNAAYSFLTSENCLGNRKRNIKKVPINVLKSNGKFYDLENWTQGSLVVSAFKNFSSVGRADYIASTILKDAHCYRKFLNNDENKIFNYKLFNFALIDNIFKAGCETYAEIGIHINTLAYPLQTKVSYFSPIEKFKSDLMEDNLELDRAIRVAKSSLGLVPQELINLKMSLAEFNVKSDDIKNFVRKYYANLHPEIVKYTSKI